MLRLAIILGCSTYDQLDDLDAAEHDARAVQSVLSAGDDYHDTLVVQGEARAATVKTLLADFCRKHQEQAIDEVFFYYSGHGLYRDDEFYYALSGFDLGRARETGLENSEVDALLRSLEPNLTVKVVDACNSGIRYVKGTGFPLLRDHIKGTSSAFEKCYFMFSSARDQNSYADDHLSEFTHAFLRVLAERPDGDVRYKDLVSGVSDFFEGDTSQRPFFVSQADQTEIFCTMNESIRGAVARAVGDRSQEDASDTVLAHIQKGARNFVEQEAAFETIRSFAARAEALSIPTRLADYYQHAVETGQHVTHVGAAEIGTWLAYYGTDVLARPKYKIMSEMLSLMDRVRQVEPRKYESSDVESYEHTVSTPVAWIGSTATPRYPNVHRFTLLVVPLLARDHVRLFAAVCEYHHRTWERLDLLKEPSWEDQRIPWGELDTASTVQRITTPFWRRVAEHVTAVAGVDRAARENFISDVAGAE